LQLIFQSSLFEPLATRIDLWIVVNARGKCKKAEKALPGYENKKAALNARVFDLLREPLPEYLPADSDYADAFDRFEYLTALVHLDLALSSQIKSFIGAPLGLFAWGHAIQNEPLIDRMSAEAKKQGEGWAPIRSGLFDSLSRFNELDGHYRKEILPLRWN